MEQIESRLNEDAALLEVDAALSALALDVDERTLDLSQKVSASLSLTDLQNLERDWLSEAAPLSGWKSQLNRVNREREADIHELASLSVSWLATLKEAGDNSAFPTELLDRLQETNRQLQILQEKATASQANTLILLTRVSAVGAKIQSGLATVKSWRQQQAERIFQYNADPIWRSGLGSLKLGQVGHEVAATMARQCTGLSEYFADHPDRFLSHVFVLSVLYAVMCWARRRVSPWEKQDATLRRVTDVFRAPFMTALLLSVLGGGWLYPNPPDLLQTLLAITALIPAGIVLSRLVPRDMQPTLFGLGVLFFVDQLRKITFPQELVTRVLFLCEISAVLVYLGYRVLLPNLNSNRTMQKARLLAVLIFGLSLCSVLIGFVRLGYAIGEAALSSAYLAVFLFSGLQVLEAIVLLMLRSPPLSLLASVQHYQEGYRQRLNRWARILAGLIFLWQIIDVLGIGHWAMDFLTNCLRSTLQVGVLTISLGRLLGLGLSLWIPYHLARFACFVLEEDVYPHLNVSQGATYTLSTILRYLLLVLGGLVGLAAIGIDMTKFAIAASALGVGIGFGLQNIVNNFVSGLILLFERPVEIGHVIDISGQVGTLRTIGLRASVLRTVEGSEVVVPNGELLSSRVTNWTLSDQLRLLRIPVGVAYGNSPRAVKTLLLEVAGSHPKVLAEPGSEAIFLSMGDSSLDFELRAWTDDFGNWVTTRSDLMTEVYERLTAEGIEIPFPQRVVHLQSQNQRPNQGPSSGV